jgi:hypothetical protein
MTKISRICGGRFGLFFRGSGATLCAVKKVSKAILIALAGLVALAVFLLFCVNLYIQSPRVQAQIQDELGRALRLPLKITNTSLSPWRGLRVSGISVPNGRSNFLEATAFDASYRFFPLLAGRLVIPEMRVENPKIVWPQDAEGNWRLPVPEKPPGEAETAAEKSGVPGGKSRGGMKVVVQKFVVNKGAMTLLNQEGKPTATLTDVNITYNTLTDDRIEGVATIGKLLWADLLALMDVRAPFTYAGEDLTMRDVTASLGGGPLRGNFRAQPAAPKAPFECAFDFDNVKLDRLAIDTGWKSGRAAGILAGKVAAHGDMNRTERAEGAGELHLREGQLQQLEIVQTIGQVLGIRELANLQLRDGNADFHLGGEKIHIDRLTLASPDLELGAKGYVRFSDRKVALDAQIGLGDSLVKQLPDMIRSSFGTADSGRKTIDFNVTGTTDKLRTNILDKLIGQKLNQQFDSVLTSIFGGEKKDDKKKAKDEEEQRKKDEKEKKKKKKEEEKAAALAPVAPPPAAARSAPAAPVAPTTAITPIKQ